MKKIYLVLSLISLTVLSPSYGQTIIDGNFTSATQGVYTFGSIFNPNGNSNSLESGTSNGWSVSANSVDVTHSGTTDYVVLNSLLSILGSGGAISETVTGLTSGQTYSLSFETAAPGLNLSLLGGAGVSVSATNAHNVGTSNPFSAVATVSVGSFASSTPQTFTFTATSTASTISFSEPTSIAQLSLGGGFAVTDIGLSLASVPEPRQTAGLMMLLLGGLVALRSAQRQKPAQLLTDGGEIVDESA